MKKEIPILISTPLIQPTMDEIKTLTRRLNGLKEVNKNPDDVEFVGFQDYPDGSFRAIFQHQNSDEPGSVKCPYGRPGDILFVREKWRMNMWHFEDSEVRIGYAHGVEYSFTTPDDDNEKGYECMVRQFEKLVAKDIIRPGETDEEMMEFTGKANPFNPSIHLPKWCSRIWLEVTEVRVERLHDITWQDIEAEGVIVPPNEPLSPTHAELWQQLWIKINGDESYESNPWVWVISFKVLSTTGKPGELNNK